MEKVISAHTEEFGSQPDIVLSAPGRFHLIGEHSWYFKDKTLSMAVNLPVYIAISLRQDTSLRFYFPQTKERKRGNISSLKYRREDRWANNVKAMIYSFISEGFSCTGMNISVHSEILPSAGFGITTAIKAASALALRELYNFSCSDQRLVSIIEKGNRQFLNTEHFASDINAALFARENSCILTDHESGTFSIEPFEFDDIAIILTDARVPRISVWNEDSLRTEENLKLLSDLRIQKNGQTVYEDAESEISDVLGSVGEDVRRRLVCIMKEHQFVLEAVEGLRSGTFSQFARSVNKSHEIMRDLYLISCPEIDWLIKRVQEFDPAAARNPTACARITGKGFGRCTYTMIKKDELDSYIQKLADYERIFGFHPASYVVKPVSGACIAHPFKKA